MINYAHLPLPASAFSADGLVVLVTLGSLFAYHRHRAVEIGRPRELTCDHWVSFETVSTRRWR
jgi:hypothetical protein